MSEYDRYEPYESQRRADYEDRWAEQRRYAEPVRGSYEPKKKRNTGKIVALVLALVVLIGASGVGGGVLYASMNNLVVSEKTETAEALPETGDAQRGPASEPALRNEPETEAPEINRGGTLNAQIVGGSSAPTSVRAQYTGDALSAEEIYALAVNSCVGIQTDVTSNVFGQVVSGAISGSGFIISPDGYILTNYHVIQTADEQGLDITVNLYNGDSYTAAIVGKDAENDVALIKIDGENLPALVLNTSGDLMVGQTVYAIGNPLGELTYSMSNGIVSALDREITVESNVSINMFQLTAAINSGNSGGPVLNERGEVIGIASAKYADTGVEGLGFAIPVDDAMKIANDIVTYGFVRGKPYFGITVATAGSSGNGYGYPYGFGFGYGYGQQNTNTVSGAEIRAVDENSCAAKAGLEVGDIITKLGDKDIRNQSDLIIAKAAYHAGDTATLTVYRDGEYQEKTIVFDELVLKQNTGSVQG